MKLFVKPDGTEIEVSNQSIEFAKSLGWKAKRKKRKEAEKPQETEEKAS